LNESDGHSESAAGTPTAFCIAAVAFESRTLLSARVIMFWRGASSPVIELMAFVNAFGMAAQAFPVKRTSQRGSRAEIDLVRVVCVATAVARQLL